MKVLGLMILMLASLNLFAAEKMSVECSKIAQERESLGESNDSIVRKRGKEVYSN